MTKTVFSSVLGSLFATILAGGTVGIRTPVEPLAGDETFEFKYSGAIAASQPSPDKIVAAWAAARTGAQAEKPKAGPAVQLELCVARLNRETAAACLPVDPAGVKVVSVDSDKAADLLDRLNTRGEVTVLSEPALRVKDREIGHVSVLSRANCVDSYVLRAVRGATLAEPRVKVVEHGLVIGIHLQVDDDRSGVKATLNLLQSDLLDPLLRVTARPFLLVDRPIKLDIPVIVQQQIETQVHLADHASILVSGLSTSDPEVMQLILLRARVIG